MGGPLYLSKKCRLYCKTETRTKVSGHHTNSETLGNKILYSPSIPQVQRSMFTLPWKSYTERVTHQQTTEGINYSLCTQGFPSGSVVKNPPAMGETWVRSLGWEDPLEKGKVTHSGILAWRIPTTIQSMRYQRVRYS